MTVFVWASWQRSVGLCASRFSATVRRNVAKWRRGFAPAAAAVAGSLLLASCMGGGTPEPVAGPAFEPYDITQVDVTISKNVTYGVAQLDGTSQQDLANKLAAALKLRLTQELVLAKSTRKSAKLEVVLDKVNMSSALGRTLLTLEGNSQIGGDLTLKDKRTGAIIASRPAVYIDDDSTKASGGGRGALGAVATIGAMAVNASQSSDEERINSVVGPFTSKVKVWLGRSAVTN